MIRFIVALAILGAMIAAPSLASAASKWSQSDPYYGVYRTVTCKQAFREQMKLTVRCQHWLVAWARLHTATLTLQSGRLEVVRSFGPPPTYVPGYGP